MGSVQVVTGYVPIEGHPRSATEYGELSERIFGPLAHAGVNITRFMQRVEDTWLHIALTKLAQVDNAPVAIPLSPTPQKDTLAYHCVQHQKFGWLKTAAEKATKDIKTLVWLDFGVGHVPGVTAAVIQEFLADVEQSKNDFAIPGCWPKDKMILTDNFPCWRFCGGVIVVPVAYARQLALAISQTTAKRLTKRGTVTWEVNTLAEAEQDGLIQPRWYQADHDASMFSGYTWAAP
jgi:hypothetical protein